MASDGGGEFEETLSVASVSLSSENLDLDLEELDDVEYDIPPVENPPTLESILNEPDDGSEDEATNLGMFSELGDTVSMASTNSRDSRKRLRKSPMQYDVCGPVLRHVILRGISSQLISATDRISAGMPTAMAAGVMLAVGTSHGLVLVFDGKQVLKWCLGDIVTGTQYGSVSALCFNNDCTRLLCGFDKGPITMWDITHGKLLRTMTDVHQPGTAVLHVKFTDDPTLALCSDSGGSVFELNFRRLMGVRSCDSRCLFSGSRGEVCTIQPLLMANEREHPLLDYCIIAMATLSKVIVISIRPRLKVLFSQSLQANPTTLPLLAWQFVIIQISESMRLVDPVFSFARENKLYFLQMSLQGKDRIIFVPLKTITFDYTLLSFLWLNSRTLVALDTMEHLHVIDVRTQDELELSDLADVQLVYSSSYFKGLSTGGNVSKAMICAGDHACYQSVIGYCGQLLLLGTKSVHLITIRGWKDRIEHFIKQNKFQEALALAQTFLENRGKAVVGLYGKKEEKVVAVAKVMWKVLDMFLENTLSKRFEEMPDDVAEEFLFGVIPSLLQYHLLLALRFSELERQNVPLSFTSSNIIENLFGRVSDVFRTSAISRTIFLESLEVHIMNNEFLMNPLPPSILHDFVEHYAENKLYDRLELCIVHLNVTSLDLHQVLSLCWQNSLYDAVFYIHNKAMNDYTGPLEELLSVLQAALKIGKQLTDTQVMLGNKILVYISCCLAGRAYPIGNIPTNDIATIKEKVFFCLINKHSSNRQPKESLYPHLRTLLHFDTREFLNVLALAFEEPEFDRNESIWKRQDVVDILINIMHNNTQEFSPTQVGCLFTFLARQMAKHETTIVVVYSLFEQVLEYITDSSDESRHEERQQALLELHSAGGLEHYDEKRLLQQAEKAHFFRICELLYLKRKEYNRILPCYLKDPARRPQVFLFAKQILNDDSVPIVEKENLKQEIVNNIKDLLEINNMKTAQIMLECLPENLNQVVKLLESTPEVQFKYLEGIFECRQSMSNFTPGTLSSDVQLEPTVVEKYIDLLCCYSGDESSLLEFIKTTSEYRLEATLKIVQKHNFLQSAAYLLERLGRAQDAFNILIKSLEEIVKDILEHPSNSAANDDIMSNFQSTMLELIQFCQRNSLTLNEQERETLWFQLLETLLVPLRKLNQIQDASEYHKIIKESTTDLLNNMMTYVKLPAILEKILKDPSYKVESFSEIRYLLLGMLETYNYEKTLLQTTNHLINSDLHRQLSHLRLIANRSFAVHNNRCSLCHESFNELVENPDKKIVIFRCGHSFHTSCLILQGKLSPDEPKSCSICPQQKVEAVVGGRMTVEDVHSFGVADTVAKQGSLKTSAMLNSQQIQGLDRLRQLHETGSRFSMLSHLAKKDSHKSPYHKEKSIFQREDFKLRLAPPRTKTSS